MCRASLGCQLPASHHTRCEVFISCPWGLYSSLGDNGNPTFIICPFPIHFQDWGLMFSSVWVLVPQIQDPDSFLPCPVPTPLRIRTFPHSALGPQPRPLGAPPLTG